MKFNLPFLLSLVLAVLSPGLKAQALKPAQIVDLYTAAYADLNYKPVAVHIHPEALAAYRKITGQLLAKAVETHGKTRVLAFFQNLKELKDLQVMNDETYWAYAMASAQQFDPESPVAKIKPIGELTDDKQRLLLVYPSYRKLSTLPDSESLGMHTVYVFEKHEGQWKLASFAVTAFETSLNFFLQQESAAKTTPVK